MDTKQQAASAERLPLELVIEDGRITVADAEHQSMRLTGAGGSVGINGEKVSVCDGNLTGHTRSSDQPGATAHTVTFEFPACGFAWVWNITERATEIDLTARLVNIGNRTLDLDSWNVLDVEATEESGFRFAAARDELRFFGWHPWNMQVETVASDNGQHQSHNLCHLFDPEACVTFLSGFVTLDRMACRHELVCSDPNAGATYRAICDFGHYSLEPGEEIESERLQIGFYRDPYQTLESWAETVFGVYQPAFADVPPVGWNGSWIDQFSDREDCWERVALDNARILNERLAGFGVRYVWTSQSNLKDGIPGNWLTVEERQIPGGLRSFFKRLKDLGFTPGLWASPFWFFAEAEGTLEENRENLLKDATGEPITESSDWEFDINSDPEGAERLTKYYLDGSHPKTKEYVRKVFRYYREIGVRYYMLDFLAIKSNGRLLDRSVTHMQAARSILEVIREAAGDDTHLQTAVASTPGFVGLINAARVGRDFGEGRPLFPPYNGWRNSICVLHDLHFGNTKYLIQNAAASYFTHRRIYLNDFNILTINKPMPLDHAKIAVTVFGLGGSPLMLGDDYRKIDPERLRMVKLCLPRTRNMPVPADLFDHVYPDDYCRMLKLSVETASDSYLLVAVCNLDEEAYEIDLELGRLGLDDRAAYRVWEFWSEEYLGTFRDRVHSVVPPASCRLYRISRARQYPWLLSTDMHVQQGAVEIESIGWDQDTMTLSGIAKRPEGERGNLFFLMPRKYRLINHEETLLLKDVRDMNVIIGMPIQFASERQAFELRFEPVGTRYVSRKGWLPYATEEEWLAYVANHRGEDDTRVVE